MGGDTFLDVFDPIGFEMNVGVEFDEISRSGKPVNVSDGKQFKVAVTIGAMLRVVQLIVKTSQLIDIAIREKTGTEMDFAVGL